jgi:predicted dehydrogenase
MRHVTGLEVAEVSAESGALLWDCGVDDVAVLLLRMDNGAVGSIDPSWSVPEGNPWDYDFFLRIVGTGGSFEIDDTAAAVGLVDGSGLQLVSLDVDVDAALIDAFVRSVAAGQVLEPCATGEDGLRALEVALAGYESAASGRRVRLR